MAEDASVAPEDHGGERRRPLPRSAHFGEPRPEEPALSLSKGRGDVRPPPARSTRVLLPFAWCLWLLVFLAPALLVAPRVDVRPFWLTAEAAPAALLAAAAFFVTAVWPFWPALAAPSAGLSVRAVALSLLELAMLFALAAPFALVAWSVGAWAPSAGPLAAAIGTLAVLGLGIRAAYLGMGPVGGRWLVAAAILACAGPLMIAYAAGETLNMDFPRLLEISPVASAMRLGVDGWPEGTWRIFAGLILWPVVGLVLLAGSISESRQRRLRGEAF